MLYDQGAREQVASASLADVTAGTGTRRGASPDHADSRARLCALRPAPHCLRPHEPHRRPEQREGCWRSAGRDVVDARRRCHPRGRRGCRRSGWGSVQDSLARTRCGRGMQCLGAGDGQRRVVRTGRLRHLLSEPAAGPIAWMRRRQQRYAGPRGPLLLSVRSWRQLRCGQTGRRRQRCLALRSVLLRKRSTARVPRLPVSAGDARGHAACTRQGMRLPLVLGFDALAAVIGVACGGHIVGSHGEPVQAEGGAAHSSPGEGGATDDSASTLDTSGTADAANLVDASCGNADAPCGDADAPDSASCAIVMASQYDQSCKVDSDCVAVGEVPSCPASACDSCTLDAINQSASERYAATFQQAFASRAPGSLCGCPCEGGAVCSYGKCQAVACGGTPGESPVACLILGGRCVSAGTTCRRVGPPDKCPSSDEVCCIP